jgi:hypothetical protein
MELFVEGGQQGDGPASGRRYALTKVLGVEAHRCTVAARRPGFFRGFRIGQTASSRIPNEIIEDESVSFFW